MDVIKLKSACEQLLPLLDDVDYSKPTPKGLLSALLEKTIEQIDSGQTSDNLMFTAEELVNLVKTGTYNKDQIKKFKADHYKEANNLLDKVNELKKEKNSSSSYFKLKLSDTGEKGGNKKHHYLDFDEIKVDTNDEFDKDANYTVKKDISADISYEAIQLPKPVWYAKPFMSIELTHWRLKLYLIIPMSLLVIAYYLFINSIFSSTSKEVINLAIFASIVFVLWKLLIPFFLVTDRRIVIAPEWMLRLKQLTAQLESVKLDKLRPNGRPYRKIILVIYEADCPICGNKVAISNGKREFKGRLIGMCDESPREHIFSFDHVTQSGNKLR
jgi:hypothetical protein